MIQCPNIKAIQKQVKRWKTAGQSVAFVPTMGNLHNGHLALIEKARESADRVVASVFVNPLQFNEGSDFSGYPRSLEEDIKKLKSHATDALFVPELDEIYPFGQQANCKVVVPVLSDLLEGACRPGHFTGVATVVNKLFNIVQPDVACFGEKDFQQLMLIRRMVQELNMPIEILAVPTIREADGLAMSSRNSRLTAPHRAQANALYSVLQRVKTQLEQGNRQYSELEEQASAYLQAYDLGVEYTVIRRSYDLQVPDEHERNMVVLLAVRFADVRLIDNMSLTLPSL